MVKQSHYRHGQTLRAPGIDVPRFQDSWLMNVVGCQPLATTAFTHQEISLILISVGG
jgi:hypothetical protein